ncbi:hypothetical protein NEOLEDRAFT_1068437 [Neolentinus lepideus HHB14362 ss-1]|uniref:Core domain-containing protein n=1 Tax=Neolentinus lepideus HHB14362 ss-1 TaxID=1314782 RepID=A0A165RJF0_9AGAM|nr:hypothetical protein NEOLEDRAFT_1068437 [Neolentinus lepideus HHB14362 ss-1]
MKRVSRPGSFALSKAFLSGCRQTQCRTYSAFFTASRPTQEYTSSLARRFSTGRASLAALASHPPSQRSVLLHLPSPEALEEEELDVELVPKEEATVDITDRAAEQLRSIATRENNPDAALRIAVESGGCHGYQYKMELATSRNPDDYYFTHPNIRPANILIDAISLSLLKGSTIDFATELIGSSFRIMDNPQAKGSGCGCGVSWELKV